jgi:carboxymethylenebutenolidase
MQKLNRKSMTTHRRDGIGRRSLLQSLVTFSGAFAAAHLFLEFNGLPAALASQTEAQAANIETDTVHYSPSSGGYQIEAFLARPKASGKYPAAIVVQDNRGVNDNIKEITRRFAGEGFFAVAPDLLSRSGGMAKMRTPEEAGQAINKIPVYGAIDDLKDTYSFLNQNANVDHGKISCVGFGWGGWRAFMLATGQPQLYRTVVFYGTSPDTGLDTVNSPVLAHYAEYDYGITGNAVWTQETLSKVGKKFQYFVYPKTFHAFCSDGPRYNADATKLAWSRTVAFLRDQPVT